MKPKNKLGFCLVRTHTHTENMGKLPSTEQALYTHHRTCQGWRYIFKAPSHTGLSGDTDLQDAQHNTLPFNPRCTGSPAIIRQDSHLQSGGKGCWGALSYSSPMHTALGSSPSHRGLTQCKKSLHRSDVKLEQTHNQERFKTREKMKAGKCFFI